MFKDPIVIRLELPRKLPMIAVWLGLGGLLLTATLSFADGQQSTSTITSGGLVVPYDGYLVLNSTPVDSSAQAMRFSLYDAPTGGSAVWVESQGVSVYNGRFSVGIGKGVKDPSITRSFDDVILDAERLYLSIEVEDATGAFVALSGRQAIEAAPYAAWAGQGSNFAVKGQLTVDGSASVGSLLSQNGSTLNGSATVNGGSTLNGGATVNGQLLANSGIRLGNDQNISNTDQISGFNDLRLYGNGSALGGNADLLIADDGNATFDHHVSARHFNGPVVPGYTNWSTAGEGAGGAAIYNDSGTYKALMVVGNRSAGGTRKVQLYDDVTVNGSLRVGGNLQIDGDISNLTVSGETRQNRFDSQGTSSSDLGPDSNRICFLTRAGFQELDSGPEIAKCEINVRGGRWYLDAVLDANSDLDAYCGARCLTW